MIIDLKKGFLIFLFFITPFIIFFHTRGIIYHDSGYILHSAQRMLRGEMIYKDFDFVYTPFSVFITAIIFKIFGESILIERVFAIGVSLLTLIILYRLTKLITNNQLLIFLSLLMYFFWGPIHINFLSPVIFSLLFGLLTNYFLLTNNILLAGITISLTFLSKQNFGIVLLINSLLFLILVKPFSLRNYFIGLFVPIVFFIIYLIASQSLIAYFNNFFFYTITKIAYEGVLNTQFIYGKSLYAIAKFFFYLFPAIISLAALYFLKKQRKKYFFLSTFVIFYYVVSIRPETDFIHLIPALSLTGIPFVFIIKGLKNSFQKKLVFITVISLIILGIYIPLFKGYYRWEEPLILTNNFLSNPRGKVWVNQKQFNFINQLNNALDRYTKPNDYIFINDNVPLLYFLTERRNATRYDFIVPYLISNEDQKQIIQVLTKKEVKIILTLKNEINIKSYLNDFLKENYQTTETIGKYILWKRKF